MIQVPLYAVYVPLECKERSVVSQANQVSTSSDSQAVTLLIRSAFLEDHFQQYSIH
jgi:hypothetical protein